MRTLAVCLALCCCASLAPGQNDRPAVLLPHKLKIGDQGVFSVGKKADGKEDYISFRVKTVVGKDEMLLSFFPFATIMTKGLSTSGIDEGELVHLSGVWKVTDRKRFEGKTYYVVERLAEKKKAP